MRIVTFDQYATSKDAQLKTRGDDDIDDQSEYVGVAIGPRSDEGRVYVDGHLLQAGRVLALRCAGKQGYKVRRFTPYDAALACISTLELQLFEDAAELAVEVARPSGRYSAIAAINGTTATLGTFPFVGRRQARFLVTGPAAATLSYSLYGVSWSDALGVVKKKLLKTETGVAIDATDNTYAFYMGGNDVAEAWDALRLDVTTDSLQTWSVDVETIGELGAR